MAGRIACFQLLNLPSDILVKLPDYLDSLHDLYSMILTCKTLNELFRDSMVELPTRFHKEDGRSLFPPHPHLLVAGTARQVADWAVQSCNNRDRLIEALKGGIDGLFDLVVEVSRMSLADARELHRAKCGLLNPVTRMIDLEAGPSKREAGLAKIGATLDDDDEYWTILEYPELSLLFHWIYCGLFYHTIDAAWNPDVDSSIRPLSLATRATFLSYCMPDINNKMIIVPDEIHEQAHLYAVTPWKGGQLRCLMFLYEQLKDTTFSVNGVREVLELAIPGEKADGIQNPDSNVSDDRIWYQPEPGAYLSNVILHNPLLCLRLLLPGGRDATADEVKRIKIACATTSHQHKWDGLEQSDDSDALSDFVTYESMGEGQTPRQETWHWRSMIDDIDHIIWDY